MMADSRRVFNVPEPCDTDVHYWAVTIL